MGGGAFSDLVTTVLCKNIYDIKLPEWFYLSPVGDAALNLLAITKGKIFYLDEVTAVYRFHLSGSWTRKSLIDVEYRAGFIKKLILMREAFDHESEYQYLNFIQLKNRKMIKEFLVRYNYQKDDIDFFYSRLNERDIFHIKFFRFFHSDRIHGFYRKLRNLN